MRVCTVPGCPELVDRGRCPEHETAARRAHWARTRAYAGAGHRRTFRAAVLAREPICRLCPSLAVIADHWPRSRAELIALQLDPDNPRYGRGLCKPCHDRETARAQPGGWNARET